MDSSLMILALKLEDKLFKFVILSIYILIQNMLYIIVSLKYFDNICVIGT